MSFHTLKQPVLLRLCKDLLPTAWRRGAFSLKSCLIGTRMVFRALFLEPYFWSLIFGNTRIYSNNFNFEYDNNINPQFVDDWLTIPRKPPCISIAMFDYQRVNITPISSGGLPLSSPHGFARDFSTSRPSGCAKQRGARSEAWSNSQGSGWIRYHLVMTNIAMDNPL
jgi:hypothetical protein